VRNRSYRHHGARHTLDEHRAEAAPNALRSGAFSLAHPSVLSLDAVRAPYAPSGALRPGHRTTSDRYGHLYDAAQDRLRDHLDDTYEEATDAATAELANNFG
jgi:hypothetical protein